MSAQDGLGCAIPLFLADCFFLQSVTSEALRRLSYSLDSFTLSNNLPGLLSSIANVGCRRQLLEALLCIVRYAIKTLHKFLQANDHLSAGRHFATALTKQSDIQHWVFLYGQSQALQSQMGAVTLSPV